MASPALVALIATHIEDQTERAQLAGVCKTWRAALRDAWHSCSIGLEDCRRLRGPQAPLRVQDLEVRWPREADERDAAAGMRLLRRVQRQPAQLKESVCVQHCA